MKKSLTLPKTQFPNRREEGGIEEDFLTATTFSSPPLPFSILHMLCPPLFPLCVLSSYTCRRSSCFQRERGKPILPCTGLHASNNPVFFHPQHFSPSPSPASVTFPNRQSFLLPMLPATTEREPLLGAPTHRIPPLPTVFFSLAKQGAVGFKSDGRNSLPLLFDGPGRRPAPHSPGPA